MSKERFSIIDNPLPGDPYLPAPNSLVLPIVDEKYGGVIGWANTEEQAQRIVNALRQVEPATDEEIDRSFDAYR